MRKNNFEYQYDLAYYRAAEYLESLSKNIRRTLDMEIRQKRYNGKYGPNPLIPLKYMTKEEREDFFKKVN